MRAQWKWKGRKFFFMEIKLEVWDQKNKRGKKCRWLATTTPRNKMKWATNMVRIKEGGEREWDLLPYDFTQCGVDDVKFNYKTSKWKIFFNSSKFFIKKKVKDKKFLSIKWLSLLSSLWLRTYCYSFFSGKEDFMVFNFSAMTRRDKKKEEKFPHSRERKLNEQRRRYKIKWHYLKLLLMAQEMRIYEAVSELEMGKNVLKRERGKVLLCRFSQSFCSHFVWLFPFNFRFYYRFRVKERMRVNGKTKKSNFVSKRSQTKGWGK